MTVAQRKPVGIPASKLKKHAIKVVKHPLLVEAAATVGDPEWAELITAAAYGLLPSSFCFHENTLSYEKGGNRINRCIDRIELVDDPEVAAMQFMDFIREKGQICTSLDVSNSQTQGIETDTIIGDDWKKINNKTRGIMLSRYTMTKIRENNITGFAAVCARKTIERAFLAGLIKPTDFIMEGRTIKNIVDVYWKDTRVIVDRHRDPKEPSHGIPFVRGCSLAKPTSCQAKCISILNEEIKMRKRCVPQTTEQIKLSISRASILASKTFQAEEA